MKHKVLKKCIYDLEIIDRDLQMIIIRELNLSTQLLRLNATHHVPT